MLYLTVLVVAFKGIKFATQFDGKLKLKRKQVYYYQIQAHLQTAQKENCFVNCTCIKKFSHFFIIVYFLKLWTKDILGIYLYIIEQ